MPTWNPAQYLKFADERTRPCRDLASRIAVPSVRRVIDLGCGPGNSTAVLRERWPGAEFVGLDSSAEMIERARNDSPKQEWMVGDIREWAADRSGPKYDAVFSNAALQWVDDHASLYPQLLARVAPGGALAVQIPGNIDAPQHRLMRELARLPEGAVRDWHHHEREFYYDALAPTAARLDLWASEYLHILPEVEAVLEWYRGTALRPFLAALKTEEERKRYTAKYLAALRTIFVPRPAGGVLFPFRRIFTIAYQA